MKYFILIFYIIFLMFFWVGFINGMVYNFKPPIIGFIFSIGILFSYSIANSAEKKGYSWWKNFLLWGFISTGIPLIGLIKIILLGKTPNKNITNNTIEINLVKIFKNNNDKIKEIDFRNVLIYNSLEEYINTFETNHLTDINIIMNLTEDDYEKIGIFILGDVKKLIIIFSKKVLINNIDKYTSIKKNDEIVQEVKLEQPLDNNFNKCKNCKKLFSNTYSGCPHCGSSLYETLKSETNQRETWVYIYIYCDEKNRITSSICKGCGKFK